MTELTPDMCKPRKAHALTGETSSGWFYVGPRAIYVMAQAKGGGITGVRLTKRQLERALSIIQSREG